MESNSDVPGHGSQSDVEQRGHPRHRVDLDAELTAKGIDAMTCKIRNFSGGGVFVSFDQQASAHAPQERIARNDQINIRFVMTLKGQERSFDLKARVARVSASGLGAELVQPDPLTITALVQAAKQTAATPEPVTTGAPAPAAEEALGSKVLLKELRERLAAAVNAWMGEYFRAMQGKFLEASRDAPNAVAQRHIWNAAQFLKERREKMEQGVRAALLERVDTAASKGVRESDADAHAQDEFSSGLSLVETGEFEQFLAVSELVDKAETMFTQSLYELHQRLSFLYGVRIDKGNNPIGPAALTREFGNYVRRMQLGVEALRIALKVYQEVVLPLAGTFYEDVNRFLRDSGVPLLADPDRARAHLASTTRRRPAAPRAAGSAPPAAWNAQQAASMTPAVVQPMPAGATSYGPVMSAPLPIAPVGAFQTARALFDLGRELRAPMDFSGAVSRGPAGSLAYYNPIELATALQAVDMSTADAAGVVNAGALRAHLEQALSAQVPAGKPKQVNDSDWDVLELVVELLNAVLTDPRVLSETKPYLRRLRRPVNMVAISDKTFFDSADHPARKVINRLAGLRSLAGRRDAESILPRLEFMVDRIVAEASTRPAVFAEVAAELQELAAEQQEAQAENLSQLKQAADAQQQIVKTRRREGAATRPAALAALGGEWTVWLNRAKRLKVGDELQLGSGAEQQLARVAWVAEDRSSFVFADPMGKKVGSFGLQELAMQLRRGSAHLLEDLHMAPVDRALLKSLESLHGRLEKQAASDPQTSLLNEKAIGEAVEQALASARQEKISHAFALIEVDQFEALHSTEKHDALDRLLREVATRIRGAVDENTTLARLATDQFGVLFLDSTQGRSFAAVERVLVALHGIALAEVSGRTTASAGLVPFGGEALAATAVFNAARSALKVAHDAGGGSVRVMHVEEDEVGSDTINVRLTERLTEALDSGTTQLALQRVVPPPAAGGGSLPTHIELMPSLQVEGVRVSARTLRAAAEQMQRSTDLDRWLIQAAMQWVVAHPDRLPAQGMCILQLSPASIRDADTASVIGEAFINTAAPPSSFCFELAEGTDDGALAEAEELVHALREFGCRFAYGDFGGESTSFSRVKTLQVNLVRIGRMQNRDIVSSRSDAALVRSILEMAHFIGVPAIADCISSKPVVSKAREIGIEYLQGPAIAPVELAV